MYIYMYAYFKSILMCIYTYIYVKNALVQSNIQSKTSWIYEWYYYSEHFRFLISSGSSYTKYKAFGWTKICSDVYTQSSHWFLHCWLQWCLNVCMGGQKTAIYSLSFPGKMSRLAVHYILIYGISNTFWIIFPHLI